MRLFLITFLFLKIFSPVYANTIYYLTKIPNLEIYDLTASNGIKYLKAEKSFRVGFRENNVQCDKTSKNSIKKKFDKTGTMRQLRKRKQYIKPSVRRREQLKKAIYSNQMFSDM